MLGSEENKILTIVITYNAMQWVDRCFNSVESSTVPADIFVVDNGSTDGTIDYIREHFPNVILYRSITNLRFGRGNNIGLEFALHNGYDYVYLLNQDAWVMPDTFEKLLDVARKYPEFGILSPIQMASDGQTFEKMFKLIVVSKLPQLQDSSISNISDVLSVEMVQAAHWLVSIDCVRKIGGFSPSFPHYGEDNNYCHRALYFNYMIGVVPSARAVHDALNKQMETRKKRVYMQYISFVTILSDIRNVDNNFSRLMFCVKYAHRESIVQQSWIPYAAFFKLLPHIPTLTKHRILSKTEICPFLK